MPLGDVSLYELAEAVKDRIEDQVTDLSQKIQVVDADEDVGPEELRKSLGTARFGVRIQYPDPAIIPHPGFGSTTEFEFRLLLTVLHRKMGSMSRRPTGMDGTDVTKKYKEVVNALTGQRLSLLNKHGLECGPASYVSNESALQALQFTVTGKSQESRS